MKVGKAKYHWLTEGGFRLDSSFHMSEGRVYDKLIKNAPLGYKRLKEVTSNLFNGARFKRYYVSDKELGIPFMGSSDMLKSSFEGLKYISKKLSKNVDSLWIKEGWTLVSCSGTIGNTVYANTDFVRKTASQHILRVIPNGVLPNGYIYAYLSSKYGYALLTQGTYGAVIQHIEPHHIENLPIPIFPETKLHEIHNLITEASDLRVEANRLLREALTEIESQFKLEKSKKKFSVNIKDILKGDRYTKEARLESDFYQPATQFIERQVLDMPHALLGELSKDVSISNLRGRTFVEKGVTLITGQSLGLLKPDLSKQLSKKLTRNIEKNITLDGDILVSAFGTLGKVEYCFENFYTGVFASQQLARIRVDNEKIDEGYIYLFLKSKIGQALIQKFKTGSVIEWANWNNFCSIPVPIPEDKGKNLGLVARQIVKKIQQAFILETQAIELVENEIESWQKS